MSKAKRDHLKSGNSTADEIFVQVGAALSMWEDCEDVIMRLFFNLCIEREPLAFDVYVASNRSRRGEMMRAALEQYGRYFVEGEIEVIRKAITQLNKLASTRNEVAHGYVSGMTAHENDDLTMSGYYLFPSFSENGWHARLPRYSHTAETIAAFSMEVRAERAKVLEVTTNMAMRRQNARLESGMNGQKIMMYAKALVDETIKLDQVPLKLIVPDEPRKG